MIGRLESATMSSDPLRVATLSGSGGRDRLVLGMEPRLSWIRPPFALVLDR
jgi:hypothetical protein